MNNVLNKINRLHGLNIQPQDYPQATVLANIDTFQSIKQFKLAIRCYQFLIGRATDHKLKFSKANQYLAKLMGFKCYEVLPSFFKKTEDTTAIQKLNAEVDKIWINLFPNAPKEEEELPLV